MKAQDPFDWPFYSNEQYELTQQCFPMFCQAVIILCHCWVFSVFSAGVPAVRTVYVINNKNPMDCCRADYVAERWFHFVRVGLGILCLMNISVSDFHRLGLYFNIPFHFALWCFLISLTKALNFQLYIISTSTFCIEYWYAPLSVNSVYSEDFHTFRYRN